jgi:hypothetical protein
VDLATDKGDAPVKEEDDPARAEIQAQVRVHVFVADPLQQRAAVEPAADDLSCQGVCVAFLIAAVFEAGRGTCGEGQERDAGAPAAADAVGPAPPRKGVPNSTAEPSVSR